MEKTVDLSFSDTTSKMMTLLFCLMPVETQVGHTIANIGALVGGIFAPHHVAESNEQDSEVTGSDSVVDDDNIISLTVSSICLLDLSNSTSNV